MQGRSWLRITAFNVAAVGLGVTAGLVVVAVAGGDIGVALSSFFLGPVSSGFWIQQIFVRFVLLYTIGMGIGLALKAGLWNIGGQGQFIAGAVMIFVVFTDLKSLPAPLLFVLMIMAAVGSGLLWMVVPALLRAKYGANEIVVALLLNIVAINFGTYMLNGPIRGSQSFGYPLSAVLPGSLTIPSIFPGTGITYAVLLVILLGITLHYLFEKSHFEIEANTVGASAETAVYAGINITKVTITVMLVSGALSGLAGATYVMGYSYHLDAGFFDPTQFVAASGYLAVIVAMLGRKNMLGIGLASMFFSYVTIGSEGMAQATGVQTTVVYAMEGIMLVGILFSSYFLERGRYQ